MTEELAKQIGKTIGCIATLFIAAWLGHQALPDISFYRILCGCLALDCIIESAIKLAK